MSKSLEIYAKYVNAKPRKFTDTSPDKLLPLVLGPSLGTSVDTLWLRALEPLAEHFPIITWDLPGHGQTKPATEPFLISDLAETLLHKLDSLGVRDFFYAGVSIGGAVGLELTRLTKNRLRKVAILCSAAKFGTPESWEQRALEVRQMGTPHLIVPTISRWFADGFLDRDPDIGGRILNNLRDADNESYALAAEALAQYDATEYLPEISTPLLAIAGEVDPVCTPHDMKLLAEAVQHGNFAMIPAASHQAIAERPHETALELISFFTNV